MQAVGVILVQLKCSLLISTYVSCDWFWELFPCIYAEKRLGLELSKILKSKFWLKTEQGFFFFFLLRI